MPAIRTISSKTVIAKIFRDFRPNNSSWTNDAIEWIGESIRGIGAYFSMQEISLCLTVEDYKVALPCNLEGLLGIEYNGYRLPPSNSNRFNKPCKNSSATEFHPTEYYKLDPGYIKTTFETGTIVVFMRGVPLDCDGYPLVPDNFTYIDAISWYIVSRLALRSDVKFSFEQAEARWEDKKYAAKNSVDFPDIDDMELFMRTWNHVLLDTRKPHKFFDEFSNEGPLGENYFAGFNSNITINT
jgi:hypothetical protein